jgi:hypothetical protein
MSIHAKLCVLVCAVALSACASSTSRDPFEGGVRESTIEVEVLNLNFNDATLYAIRMGQRIRLGIVTGAKSKTFTVRWATSQPLRFEIRLLAGDRCVTGEIMADPGDRLYLEIPQNFASDPSCRRR